MKYIKQLLLVVSLGTFLSGCFTSLASRDTERATIGGGPVTSTHKELVSLPPPEQKIVVAVYKFRDQTGQYRPNTSFANFSTAVTQGATSVLIKALQDSGWFIPIEREGLSNLLNERKMLRATREASLTEDQRKSNKEVLSPLLFASILLEGGIISYDSNVITGGYGAKYFGTGGSTQGRTDQLTIYLRAVSIDNGAVLKSVQTSKTLLSREIDFGIYKFISFKHLLEAEAGISTNEPSQMCVLEAVEKAVHDMIIEGALSGIWKLQNPADIKSPAITKYLKEKEEVEVTMDRQGNLSKTSSSKKIEKNLSAK